MVSVEELNPSEIDRFLYRHNLIGSPFSFRFSSPYSSTFFDDRGDFMKEDMDHGPTIFSSMFPSPYDGIRRSRYYRLGGSDPFSGIERTDIRKSYQPSSNARVIPITVEYDPEKDQVHGNLRFKLLNGPQEQNEVEGKESAVVSGSTSQKIKNTSFSDPLASRMSKTSMHQHEDLDKETSHPNKTTDFTAIATDNSISKSASSMSDLDSECLLQKSFTELNPHESKSGTWRSIPVEHLESSSVSTFNKKPDTNNNSSSRINSRISLKDEEEEDDHHSAASSRNTSCNSRHTTSDKEGESKHETCRINPPPHDDWIYRRLKAKVRLEHRKIDYIMGDGNCFFRALSKELYGSENHHKTLRGLIVDIIADNKSKFAQFIDREDVEEHVRKMSREYNWATTCEIYAAATLLQKDIFMLTPDHRNTVYTWLLFTPLFKSEPVRGDIVDQDCYITLCNTNGNHYDRVVPGHGGCNCFLPRPELAGAFCGTDLN